MSRISSAKYLAGSKGQECTIDGCTNRACNGRGWCWMHYTRWRRHRSPDHIETGKPESWLRSNLNHASNECLKWPFGGRTNGYGTVTFEGENDSAHRVMCRLKNGDPPTQFHEAAHSCGKGHEGCVNPNHLSWKTSKENNADKVLHGTSNRGERMGSSKLDRNQVAEIRASYVPRTMSYSKLAAKYGVSVGAIGDIVRGKNWYWL